MVSVDGHIVSAFGGEPRQNASGTRSDTSAFMPGEVDGFGAEERLQHGCFLSVIFTSFISDGGRILHDR